MTLHLTDIHVTVTDGPDELTILDGIDLARHVRRHGPLPVADACEIVRQAALGVQHAHEHNLVHRDVKPSNLMLTEDGQIKVLDLGLARLTEEVRPDQEDAQRARSSAPATSSPPSRDRTRGKRTRGRTSTPSVVRCTSSWQATRRSRGRSGTPS